MLIGPNIKSTPKNASADIFETTAQSFEKEVLLASQERPILVEFWAPWCGPCRQLMPILEKLVTAKNGKVAMAKVNIDEQTELAQAFRVQSVPMVVALYQGQPVTGFAGLRPASEIEGLINQLIALHTQNSPEAIDIPAALQNAAVLLREGQGAEALTLYGLILREDAENIDAHAGIVRAYLALNEIPQAESYAAAIPENVRKSSRFASALTAIELAKNAPAGDIVQAEVAVQKNPEDWDAQFRLAELYFAHNLAEKAANALIMIIQRNRLWEDEKARKQLLKYIEVWGLTDPVSIQARRKLSALLFS